MVDPSPNNKPRRIRDDKTLERGQVQSTFKQPNIQQLGIKSTDDSFGYMKQSRIQSPSKIMKLMQSPRFEKSEAAVFKKK